MDLYNALNNTCYENPNDLEVNTLEDAVYLSMKNDISFLIGGTLNLYEHQSTYNPNMPLRGLIYLARLYDGYVETENINLYSSALKKLPIPQYFVFYNGTKEQPDETILRLTDAFESVSDNRQPCLQCTAVMLNINYGHNLALMEKCQRLKEYSIFVDTVRIQCKKTSDPRHAVTKAVDICIEKGILRDVLVKHKAEVISMVLTSFNQKAYEEDLKNQYKEGIEEGFSLGRMQMAQEIVLRLFQSGNSPEQIAQLTGIDIEAVKQREFFGMYW
ncbi:hypothetical protein [Mediterraneibacter gnavus]|uniref:hypothetical protein n=1 Tax=Mediterraneibacter gnavus TaxID=33038 RepID=UPI0003F5643F|nr:hypothetical protein [Mediterraneibacter gnavus]